MCRFFPDGHDADVASGQLRLDADTVLEVAGEPVKECHHDSVSLLDPGHQFLPSGTLQAAAAGHAGMDQVAPDTVFGQDQELGVQVPGLVVGFADAGVAVGYWEEQENRMASPRLRKRAATYLSALELSRGVRCRQS